MDRRLIDYLPGLLRQYREFQAICWMEPADDPIPVAAGMDYIVGKFYLDPADGKTYHCTREGMADGETVNLQFLPHELIGQYFEAV